MRFRHTYMGLGSFFVLALWLLTDPDLGLIQALPFGGSTIATMVILLKAVLYVGILHISRKGLLDYLDLETAIKKAMGTAQGSGYVVIGVGIIMLAIAIVILAATLR